MQLLGKMDTNSNDKIEQNNQSNTTDGQNNTLKSGMGNSDNQNTSINDLQTGDVIIYKSQGKYYRYLQFITLENTTTSILGPLNENITKATQNVILQGPYNKIINLTSDDFKNNYNGTYMREILIILKPAPKK